MTFEPGSQVARANGCTCPRMDNANGRGWMCGGMFWVNADCPLHGTSGTALVSRGLDT